MNSDVIEIDDVHKSYGRFPVLRGLNLHVGKGEIYGLLGPNGVGKSTLMHLLLGFLKPTSGSIRIFGSAQLDRLPARVGYIPERQRYHTRYSAREYLRFMGQFSGLGGAELEEQIARDLQVAGLSESADRTITTFSKGMLQRLGIAQALLGDPELLLIDEPTSGLDPAGQREVLNLLITLRERGHTVLICTHYLQEIEYLCDRVGVLVGGQIAAEANVNTLRMPSNRVLIEVSTVPLDLRSTIESLGSGITCEARLIRIDENTPELQAKILRLLLDHQVMVMGIESLESSLERFYAQAIRGEAVEQPEPAEPLSIWAPPARQTAVLTPEPEPGVASTHELGSSRPTVLPSEPEPAPTRGEGDTLLNELLRRNHDPAPEAQPKPEPTRSEAE